MKRTDREITREIYAALGWDEAHWLPVTESLDAALAFAKAVLPGCHGIIQWRPPLRPSAALVDVSAGTSAREYSSNATTRALAVLAATLQALAERGEKL